MYESWKGERYFGGEEKSSEGTSNCAPLSAGASSWERSPRAHLFRERNGGMAWRGGIEYFIMANDRFINPNLSAIKSQPPSPHEVKGRSDGRTDEQRSDYWAAVEEGGERERIRDSWRRRPKPNLRAKRINDGRIEDRENERQIPTLLEGGRSSERDKIKAFFARFVSRPSSIPRLSHGPREKEPHAQTRNFYFRECRPHSESPCSVFLTNSFEEQIAQMQRRLTRVLSFCTFAVDEDGTDDDNDATRREGRTILLLRNKRQRGGLNFQNK